MEDDVIVTGKDRKPYMDLKGLIENGFKELNGAGIFGIAPHNNPFYMTGKVTKTLKLVVAHAFGFVKEEDDWLLVSQIGKSDYERTCRYFLKYGNVLRLDFAGVRISLNTCKI